MEKRERIIEVATQLFSERGFENTPLSLVCEKAKVSKGLIFHHFKSKNDLLREIFSQTTRLIVEMNSQPNEEIEPQAQLIELLESFFAQLETDQLYVQLNLNMILQPSTRAVLEDLIKERSSFILKTVRSIFDRIDQQNAKVLSYMLIAELDGIALNSLCIFEAYPLSEIKKHLIKRYA